MRNQSHDAIAYLQKKGFFPIAVLIRGNEKIFLHPWKKGGEKTVNVNIYDKKYNNSEVVWGVRGGDGLWVVDFDTHKKGVRHPNWTSESQKVLDRILKIPNVITYKTRSGGLHAIFRGKPEDTHGGLIGKVAPCIDIQGVNERTMFIIHENIFKRTDINSIPYYRLREMFPDVDFSKRDERKIESVNEGNKYKEGHRHDSTLYDLNYHVKRGDWIGVARTQIKSLKSGYPEKSFFRDLEDTLKLHGHDTVVKPFKEQIEAMAKKNMKDRRIKIIKEIVPGFIVKNELHLFYGANKIGKTKLQIAIMKKIIEESKLLNDDVYFIYLSDENDYRSMIPLVKAEGIYDNVHIADRNIIENQDINLINKESAKPSELARLEADELSERIIIAIDTIKNKKPNSQIYVILDPVPSTVDIQDYRAMGRLISVLKNQTQRKDVDCTAFITLNNTKGSEQSEASSYYGTSKFGAKIRMSIRVSECHWDSAISKKYMHEPNDRAYNQMLQYLKETNENLVYTKEQFKRPISKVCFFTSEHNNSYTEPTGCIYPIREVFTRCDIITEDGDEVDTSVNVGVADVLWNEAVCGEPLRVMKENSYKKSGSDPRILIEDSAKKGKKISFNDLIKKYPYHDQDTKQGKDLLETFKEMISNGELVMASSGYGQAGNDIKYILEKKPSPKYKKKFFDT